MSERTSFSTRLPNVSHRQLAVTLFVVAVILNGALWALAMYTFPRDEATAILHYRTDVGIDFVGEGQHISVLPLMGALLLVLNGVVGSAIVRADQRAAWMLWVASPLFQVVLLAAYYFLWRING